MKLVCDVMCGVVCVCVVEKELPIVPCGALANSLFNDSISLYYNGHSSIHTPSSSLEHSEQSDGQSFDSTSAGRGAVGVRKKIRSEQVVPLKKTGICDRVDKQFRFNNPPGQAKLQPLNQRSVEAYCCLKVIAMKGFEK